MLSEPEIHSLIAPHEEGAKCAQIAKEWLDKGLIKCYEIAVLYPSSRNPPAWIGKINGISFVDTSALSSAANPKSNIQNLTSPLSPPCPAGAAKREGGPPLVTRHSDIVAPLSPFTFHFSGFQSPVSSLRFPVSSFTFFFTISVPILVIRG